MPEVMFCLPLENPFTKLVRVSPNGLVFDDGMDFGLSLVLDARLETPTALDLSLLKWFWMLFEKFEGSDFAGVNPEESNEVLSDSDSFSSFSFEEVFRKLSKLMVLVFEKLGTGSLLLEYGGGVDGASGMDPFVKFRDGSFLIFCSFAFDAEILCKDAKENLVSRVDFGVVPAED